MKILVNCEGDLEEGIDRVIDLARLGGKKKVFLCFPSKGLCKIFLGNLSRAIDDSGVDKPVNIDAFFVISKENNNE